MTGSKLYSRRRAAFSLIEMVVSVGIFSVDVVSTAAIFQNVIQGERLAIASQSTQESMRYAFEMMAKEIRTAKPHEDACSFTACDEAIGSIFKVNDLTYATSLCFKNQYNRCVEYTTVGGTATIRRFNPDGTNDVSGNLAPDEIEASVSINDYPWFIVVDDGTHQPRVTVRASVYNIDFGNQDLYKSYMDLQMTISSRYYE